MVDFSLNFQQSRQPKIWLGYSLFASGVIALIFCYFSYSEESAEIVNLENEIEQISHTKPAKILPVDLSQLDAIKHQSELQQKIHQSLVISWPALFHDLEISKPEHIMLTEILPETKDNTIRLTGQANQLADVLGYVQELKKARALRGVNLLDHHIIKTENKTVVNFEIEAIWNQS